MKTNRMLAVIALMMLAAPLCAQEDEVDSVYVMGTVHNFHMGNPMQWCRVQLLRGEDTVAFTLSDTDGSFSLPPVPVGAYTLRVSREFSFYRADLVLSSNAELNIAVDTVQHIVLSPVKIYAPHHLLSDLGLLITSPSDPRLCWTIEVNGERLQREPHEGKGVSSWMEMAMAVGIYIDPKKTRNGRFVLLNDVFPDVKTPAAASQTADTAAVDSGK